MNVDDFYSRLPAIHDLIEVTNAHKFTPVPQDWCIVITDIVASTQAIEAGRYKAVNLVGACSIAAILNIAGKQELPFVFGGDGAAILIPPVLLSAAKDALLATQQVAQSEFDLVLRVGVVPVSTVLQAGFEINIAKLKISDFYSQPVFIGGGLTYATELVKDRRVPNPYHVERQNSRPQADFSGLECRWQDIQPRHKEVVSLHVLAIAPTPAQNNQTYRDVLEKIQEIYGSSEDFHPIVGHRLQLSLSRKQLGLETKIRTGSKKYINRVLYLCKIRLENLLGSLFIRFRVVIDGFNWGLYPKIVAAATDYQKFDDALRMLISGSLAQSHALTAYLDQRYGSGDLVYGHHISDRVLMTCLVFERNGRQVHFIDGAGGGFTLAAEALKQRLHRKALNWKALLRMMRLKKRVDQA